MNVAIAYCFVIFVWSTTPLAVKWSNSDLSFISAISFRMWLALAICMLVVIVRGKPLVNNKKDWLVFAVAGSGFFPTMLIVYWSAQYVPSGVLAVIFGLFPFSVGLFSYLILKENIFTPRRIVACIIAVAGLIIVNAAQLATGTMAVMGVLGLIVSVLLFGLNSVWLKAVGQDVDPLNQVTGALLVVAPFFGIVWYVFDGTFSLDMSVKSLTGVLYLAIAGSLLGHTAFFYVVRQCHVSVVGLITLITPVTAMFVAVYLEGESISRTEFFGAGLIVFSLAIYQGVFSSLYKRVRQYTGRVKKMAYPS